MGRKYNYLRGKSTTLITTSVTKLSLKDTKVSNEITAQNAAGMGHNMGYHPVAHGYVLVPSRQLHA